MPDRAAGTPALANDGVGGTREPAVFQQFAPQGRKARARRPRTTGKSTPASRPIPSLPMLTAARLHLASQLCDGSSKQKSGYIHLKGTNKHIFYWFFEARKKPLEQPLIMWLNGGPGCSSMIAVLRENGPCSITKEGQVHYNPLSWTTMSNMLW